MDKIDQWFKRAFSTNPSKTDPKQEQSSSRNSGDSNKNSNKKRKPKKGGPASDNRKNNNRKGQGNRGQNKGPKKPSEQRRPQKKSPILKEKVKIIPFGGLDEVGKNMMGIQYEDDIIIVDMGFEFPSADLLGIDYIIPDISYLEDHKEMIRGVVLTHGHLDHIGGIPYMIPRLNFPPLYGTPLTMGLVEHRVKEFKQTDQAKLHTITPGEPIKLGKMTVRFFRVMHSIPDSTGIIIETPVGTIVHTGDFKFDETPARNVPPADVEVMKSLGDKNILALCCESTNALKPGHTISEQQVGDALEEAIVNAPDRVIIASFASQIGRMQQIVDAAHKSGRTIYVSGRSMVNNIEISHKAGFLNLKKEAIYDIKKYNAKSQPGKKTLILTTGSQGEPLASLSRIARADHSQIRIKKNDTVVFSSSPIPGNEQAVTAIINQLAIAGANVINNQMMDVHTSGHAKHEELKRMIDYVKPKYLIPIHGEYFMRQALCRLAIEQCGMKEDQMRLVQNGDVLIGEKNKVSYTQEKVETKYVLIDGSGEGALGSRVLVDRRIMSQNGAVIVMLHTTKGGKLKRNPDVITRGFIYMHESEEITQEIARRAADAFKRIRQKNPGANRKDIKKYVRQSVDKYTYKTLDRSPLIIPLIIES